MSHHSTTLSHSKRVNSNRSCTRTKPIEYTRSRKLDQRAKSDILQLYTFLHIISRDRMYAPETVTSDIPRKQLTIIKFIITNPQISSFRRFSHVLLFKDHIFFYIILYAIC